MSTFHLVNVWTDPEPGPGGFVPVTESLLWLPDDFRIGHPASAVVYLHDWGGYADNPVAAALGPQLADDGFVFLSLCLRRRGVEGQLNALADDDMRDIKLALDYLHTNGCRSVFLAGDGIGGHSALRFVSRHRDRRVSGVVWMRPLPEPPQWLRAEVGEGAFDAAVASAALAARQGAGADYRIDLQPADGPPVTQNAMAFLNWWAPGAVGSLQDQLQTLGTPLVVVADGDVPEALAAAKRISSAGIADWMRAQGATELAVCAPRRLETEAAGSRLNALLWEPAVAAAEPLAVLLVHGLTSSHYSPLFQRMAPVLADGGAAALAIGMQRSGWAGHESSVLDNDLDDIGAWVDELVQLGYRKIVLAGASIGSISVGRFQSLRPHDAVTAVAHLMPTADCPDWFRRAAGDAGYEAAVAEASGAVAAGDGETVLIDIDIRQPPPSVTGARFRWTQRAASWLSWWGPEADSRNSTHIRNARVPLLLLSGTADSYNDEARFAELKAAATQAPSVAEIWYPDIDHGLGGVETQVAEDLLDWIAAVT